MQEKFPRPTRASASHDDDNMWIGILINSAKSLGITAVTATLLLFILSFAAYSYADPDALTEIFAYVSLFMSATLCGFLASRFNGERTLLCGVISGSFMAIIILLISTALSGDDLLSFPLSLVAYSGIVLLAVIGSFVGRKREKPHKKIKIPK